MDILIDMRLIKVDQVMTVPLRAIQQRGQVFDKRRSSVRIRSAEQFLGFLPRQFQPMQNGPDGFAAAAAVEPRATPTQPERRNVQRGLDQRRLRAGRLLVVGRHATS